MHAIGHPGPWLLPGSSTHYITVVVVSLVAAKPAICESPRFPCPATANVSASRMKCPKRVSKSPASRKKAIAVPYLLCVCSLGLSDCSRTLHRGGYRQDGRYKTCYLRTAEISLPRRPKPAYEPSQVSQTLFQAACFAKKNKNASVRAPWRLLSS